MVNILLSSSWLSHMIKEPLLRAVPLSVALAYLFHAPPHWIFGVSILAVIPLAEGIRRARGSSVKAGRSGHRRASQCHLWQRCRVHTGRLHTSRRKLPGGECPDHRLHYRQWASRAWESPSLPAPLGRAIRPSKGSRLECSPAFLSFQL